MSILHERAADALRGRWPHQHDGEFYGPGVEGDCEHVARTVLNVVRDWLNDKTQNMPFNPIDRGIGCERLIHELMRELRGAPADRPAATEDRREPCERCGGSGSMRVHAAEDYGVSFECEDCEACAGTGWELPPGAIHIDVCPGCNGPATWHLLDAPHYCECGYRREQFVPAIYVPFDVTAATEDQT